MMGIVHEIPIDKNGKGEGKMVPAAKASWGAKVKMTENDNTLPASRSR